MTDSLRARAALHLGFAVAALLALSTCSGSGSDAPTPPPPDPGPCNGVPSSGRCLDIQTVATCVVGADGSPRLIQKDCGDGYRCAAEPNQSYCRQTTTCREGYSRCTGATTRSVCQGGAFVPVACSGATQCRAFPGLGAFCVPSGTGVKVQGTLRYQRRLPNANLTGYGPPMATAAGGVFVEVIDGSEPLGSGFSDASGQFSVDAYRPPSTNGQLLFVPIAFNPDDSPAYGVAVASDGDTINSSTGMWAFSTSNLPPPSAGVIATGTQTIPAESSGAIHIFTWMAAHQTRMTTLFGRPPAQSLVVLWKPGIEMFCLGCYINRSGGGTDVGGGLLPLHFDNTILLSGTTGTPLQWSASVINHEIGHFVMNEYGLPPGEGGVHYFNMPEPPGLAWSEGHATWEAQATVSMGLAMPNARYFTVQQGTAFYVDLNNASASAGMIPLPNPAGPIDQNVGEIAVAAIAWDLGRTAGDAPISSSIALPRMISGLNRGYKLSDLVDFADAVQCGARATSTQVANSMSKFRFPWDGKPLCP